jgi:hypothetical protein
MPDDFFLGKRFGHLYRGGFVTGKRPWIAIGFS